AGTLPAGLSLDPSTGIIGGIPSASGSFTFTVTATDSSTGTGPYSGSRAYTLSVAAPTISLDPATLPGASVGTAYSQAVTASGGTAPYSYAVTAGALPAGVSLSAGGTLSGTPTAGGSFAFTVTATDAGGFTGSRAYSLSV
ncbi:putative Ig domain-containing protein, partial [Mitsuaria sp. WAJ17]|uniref:Ig domain-containing protein n=1 Tax=Mitsuaria sp. WAJ17 TaxID=2761452 RepID=UPI0016032D2B